MLKTNLPVSHAPSVAHGAKTRTVWGLGPPQLHTRYWAAHGVQVVRQGQPSQIVRHAELFLLIDPRRLILLRPGELMDVLNWIKPRVLFLRLHDERQRGYRERVVTTREDRFVRFQRLYNTDARLARVALTPDREIAQLWQSAPDPLAAWRRLRKFIPRLDRMTLSISGASYDRSDAGDVARFCGDLVQTWKRPDATISRVHKAQAEVWKDPQAHIDANAKFIGPVWIGAGRRIDGATTVIGPAVVWDDPAAAPPTEAIQWQTIEPAAPPPRPRPRPRTVLDRAVKRAFDLVFATLGIVLTLPIYPLVMLAIWLEDGRPIFFIHRRETLGGRRFPCVKFRSMRKDAERIKEGLKLQNQADGPQFFMDNDPRLTRVGRVLREFHLDELPQFFNVLLGHMSVVGPRPSPFNENQYCPPWREARLSVRPGVTGLWQIKRTRRAGEDFQEWIRYDLEYVENRGFRLDLVIIWQTLLVLLRRITRL